MQQSTSYIFLVRPASFGFNAQTEVSNAFQQKSKQSASDISQKAIEEFDLFASRLQEKGIDVTIIQDTKTQVKPDAVFPNNWGTFHHNGTAILYPMATPNRQAEKRPEIIETIKEKFQISRIIDLSEYEKQNKFLEGTGSIIFDHVHKKAYAGLSPRTDKDVLSELCNQIGYEAVPFTAIDAHGKEIYHTNVMMCLSEKFAVICLESIADENEKTNVIENLENTGHEIIDISLEQVNQFAGNMITLNNKQADITVMSQSAYNALTPDQLESISFYSEICPMNVSTIEKIGGGSARCMISEIFLPVK